MQQLLHLGGFPEPFLSGSEVEARRWSREFRGRLIQEDVNSLERVLDLGRLELLMLGLPDRVGSPLSINALREDLQVSHEKVWAVEHGLQTSIQIVLDIGNHLLADLGENNLEDYSSVLVRLGTSGILPIEFADKIRPMAGFRNLLVHEYAEVDLKEAYRMLRDPLGNFEDFGKHSEA